MFDTTLNGVLAQVEAGRIVLPAMQRPFVWRDERIARLVDSLLRGFPLGTALLWKTSTVHRFRKFQRDVQPDAGISQDFESSTSAEQYLVLDGQQRLTSLFAATSGTYENKALFLDVLSGVKGDKDPGDTYWDCRFLTEKEAQQLNTWPKTGKTAPGQARQLFMRFQELTRRPAVKAGVHAKQTAEQLKLGPTESERLTTTFLQCATVLASRTALQVHLIDENTSEPMPIEEILEVFVRVNSAGLVLQKSDLLMSLLDLTWNDIQPELFRAVKDINQGRSLTVTRDDLLKSLLLAAGSETRFDRLVTDRSRVEKLATSLPTLLPAAQTAWKQLLVILTDDCKITSERLFRGGHNTLLPFVHWLSTNPNPGPAAKRRLVAGIYIAVMSGIFAGAEARMGGFARKDCAKGQFPLEKLAKLVRQHYGVTCLEELLSRHLDLTLNIAHGGITIDNNPENLQRDHIFPRATLAKSGTPDEQTNHYANFHFLRDKDNLNKSDTPPHVWFRKPGEQPAYTDDDLAQRLLRWELLAPGQFPAMLEERTKLIHERALALFGLKPAEFALLFTA
ncbi:MAG: DUF262 domain-containing protein [Planctomycetes bacterium]|nr:DUF262 domain-containing protein [Planctomycetota bacterium]